MGRQTDKWVDHLGGIGAILAVADSGSLILTATHQSQADLFLLWSSNAASLGPLPSPRPWVQQLPPRRHRHRRTAMGNHPPLCAHTLAPNRDHHPGADPSAGSGKWSSSRPRAWHRTFSLMAAARRRPRTSVASRIPIAAPVTARQPPSPRLHRHRSLASLRGPLPLSPRPRRRRPGDTSPLFSPAPGGKVGGGTPVPPRSRCPVRIFFQKIIPGELPPRMGPAGITRGAT